MGAAVPAVPVGHLFESLTVSRPSPSDPNGPVVRAAAGADGSGRSVTEVIKSLLVIPVTVVVVLGVAGGLVRLAERRLAASGRPDPRPAETTPDGSIVLPIPFAQVSGEIVYVGGRRGPSLAHWQRTEDSVAWHFRLEKPGEHRVELQYACDDENAGSRLEATLDGGSLSAKVESTGGWKDFEWRALGRMNVASADWHDLRIRATTKPHESVLILRGVRLVPGEASRPAAR
jgi:hypothetical protein